MPGRWDTTAAAVENHVSDHACAKSRTAWRQGLGEAGPSQAFHSSFFSWIQGRRGKRLSTAWSRSTPTMPSPDDSPWQRAASGGSGDQGPADLASASASGSDGLRDDASWLNQWYDSKPMAEEGASSRSSGSNRLSDDAIKSLKAEIKFLAERELKALEEEEAHLRHAKYGFLKKYHDFKKGSMTARETLKNDFAISELQTKLIDLRVAIRSDCAAFVYGLLRQMNLCVQMTVAIFQSKQRSSVASSKSEGKRRGVSQSETTRRAPQLSH
jgi:hypothetical protein